MMPDPRSTTARLWLSFIPGSGERTMRVRISKHAPAVGGAVAGLLSRGQIASDDDLEFVLPIGAAVDGKSAYQLARDAGYGGTLAQWLTTLVGADGASAYQLARSAGYGGTLTQWLASLVGAAGKDATTLLGDLTISEKAVVAISAGLRRLSVTTPTSWGVAPGQDLIVNAVSLPSAAYALHDVIVTAANTISVGITTPAIAVLSSYAIPARVRRIN